MPDITTTCYLQLNTFTHTTSGGWKIDPQGRLFNLPCSNSSSDIGTSQLAMTVYVSPTGYQSHIFRAQYLSAESLEKEHISGTSATKSIESWPLQIDAASAYQGYIGPDGQCTVGQLPSLESGCWGVYLTRISNATISQITFTAPTEPSGIAFQLEELDGGVQVWTQDPIVYCYKSE